MLLLLLISTLFRAPSALVSLANGANYAQPRAKVTTTEREVLDKQGKKRTLVTRTTTYYA